MWRNYFTVGLRALTKNKTYAFINIFGLALGLAACLMILLYVRYETSFDSWVPDGDRIYQVQSVITDPESGERQHIQSAPRPTAAALAKDFPQIEFVSKAEDGLVTILSKGQAESATIHWVDEPFFRIFQFPFLHGDRKQALSGADTVTLSRTEALKRFGKVDAVGQTLTIVGETGPRDLKVTGVFEDLSKHTHFAPTIIGRFKEGIPCDWQCVNGAAYFKLRADADVQEITKQLPAWEKRNIPTESVGDAKINAGDNMDWQPVNLKDIHLSPARGEKPTNDRGTITTFAIIALLILFMACVNFTNLATARASQRAREVALRKVLGANRRQLIAQFLGESLLLTLLAMFIALALVELLLPRFSTFLEAELDLTYFGEGGVIVPVLLLVLVVGLAGGLYPAFYLSRYQPAQVLKANKSSAETVGSGRLRNALVVAQFAISIGLIICTAIVYHQTLFATRSSAGFEREGVIQLEGMRREGVTEVREALLREIGRIPGVTSLAGTEIIPAQRQTLYTSVKVPGRADPEKIGWYGVEPGFFETMRIPVVAGRALSDRFAKDNVSIPEGTGTPEDQAAGQVAARAIAQRGTNIVLNETAARRLGYTDPKTALGKQIDLAIFSEEVGVVPSTIVGIAADTRFRSLREEIEPIIYFDYGAYRRLVIRFENADPAAVMQAIQQVWKRFLPQVPIDAEFADTKLAKLYEADARRGQTFATFALLAIVIACLGLFGLASFTAERRTKEIGIRKVLGAKVRDIVRLLAWQFSKPVIVANLIAWPVAWWLMRDWLNTFDSRIPLGPTPFVLAGLLALAIAIGTIAGHAIKVARANPIHALRYE
jgi:putative ABC transport system permease protein